MTDYSEPLAMHDECELLLYETETFVSMAVMTDMRGTVGYVPESKDWVETSEKEVYCPLHGCMVEFSFLESIDPESYRIILEEARAEDD